MLPDKISLPYMAHKGKTPKLPYFMPSITHTLPLYQATFPETVTTMVRINGQQRSKGSNNVKASSYAPSNSKLFHYQLKNMAGCLFCMNLIENKAHVMGLVHDNLTAISG